MSRLRDVRLLVLLAVLVTSVVAVPSQTSPVIAPNAAGETLLPQGKPATANSYYCSEGCDLPQNGNE